MSALETPRARRNDGILGSAEPDAMPFSSPNSMLFSPTSRLMAEPFLFSPAPGGTPGSYSMMS
jgi:hypothetical protein